ncbi:MAG: RNA-binding protein [Thermoplasmata archaeon]|nr:MAG: RNA-binding protein [Thermoplasmata archaeon]
MKAVEWCISCGVRLVEEGSVVFPCPNCGEELIGRCKRCRDQGIPYVCKKCGFEGP